VGQVLGSEPNQLLNFYQAEVHRGKSNKGGSEAHQYHLCASLARMSEDAGVLLILEMGVSPGEMI